MNRSIPAGWNRAISVVAFALLSIALFGCSGTGGADDPGEDPLAAAAHVVATIADSAQRESASRVVAIGNAEAGRFEDAERLASGIASPTEAGWAWTRIGQVMADSGREADARNALRNAIAAAERLSDTEAIVVRLSDVARGYERLGDRDSAREILGRALQLCGRIADPFFRVRDLSLLAERFAVVGDTAHGLEVLASAHKDLDTIHGPASIAIGYVVGAYAAVGDPATAVAISRSSPETRIRFDGLLAAARAWYRRGDAPTADTLLGEATALARAQEKVYSRLPGLAQIAQVYAAGGRRQKATDLLGEIQDSANAVTSAVEKFDAVAVISEGFLALKEFDAASDAVDKVIDYSVAFRNPNITASGARTLTAMAEAFIDSGSTTTAVRLLDRALSLSELVDSTARVRLLPQIIFDYARAGSFRRALELLASTSLEQADRVKLLASIGSEYAKRGKRPDEAEREILGRIVEKTGTYQRIHQ
jgi:tetratricopeptide (TPR) repeat protein